MAAFARAWWQTLQAICADKGVLLLLAIAPVLYGFFYPWPYTNQVVTRVPVAVVDLDHSSLSRQITRFASASPRLDVRWVGSDVQAAQQALWAGDIEGFAVLPPDLKRQVVRGQSAVVRVEGDGAYALLNKAVLYGFAEAVGTVSAGVEIRKLQAAGQSARQAAGSRNPVGTQMLPLFNPTEGYGSYVVPAVALLILQQTLLMGAAMLAGTWVEAGQYRASPAQWLGRIAALSSVGVLAGLFYLGWEFTVQDFPRGGNPAGALVLLALYMPAVACWGCVLGLWFADRERSMQVLLLTALPMAFLSGFSWPAEALPWPLQTARWLVPSTAGIQASLQLNQMGASLGDVAGLLVLLLALALGFGALLLWCGRLRPPP